MDLTTVLHCRADCNSNQSTFCHLRTLKCKSEQKNVSTIFMPLPPTVAENAEAGIDL